MSYNSKPLKGELLEKSVLQEIPIIDLGSNKNALKLYNENDFVGLYFQEIQGLKILSLTEARTPKNIIKTIEGNGLPRGRAIEVLKQAELI